MIELRRLNDSVFILNPELIETIDSTPDSVITIINGKKYVVKESVEEIVEKVLEYKKKIYTIQYID